MRKLWKSSLPTCPGKQWNEKWKKRMRIEISTEKDEKGKRVGSGWMYGSIASISTMK